MQNKRNIDLIYICNVYGPTHYREKMDFWDSLLSLKANLHGKDVIIAGDFNTTKLSLEKRGGSIIRDSFGEKPEDLMADLDLLDPMPKNGKFTWSNKRAGPGHIGARLDRFRVSTTFLQKVFLPSSHIISSATFDHNPISLSFTLPTNMGPIPFRFNPLWLNNAKTLDLTHLSWNSSFFSSSSFIWQFNLRVVHSSLKNWATTSYSEPAIVKKSFNQVLIPSTLKWT